LFPAIWIAAWVFLFIMTHIPRVPDLGLPKDSDKVIHLVSYFTLAMLGGRVAMLNRRRFDRAWFTKWVLIYALYAAFDELTQPMVGRVADWSDWIADVIGAAAALSVLRLTYGPGAGDVE
jgi:VanZ family protein